MSAPDARRGHDGDDEEALRLAVAARLQERYRRLNVAAFWLLGFFNNYYYCIILSASESIAEAYGLKSLTALVSWAEIIGGCWVRLLNAFVFTHFGYNWRILIVVAQAVVGVALICVAPICGSSDGFRFTLSLIGIASLGNASSYGESAMLGFLDRLPPMTLAGWSSGTGLSGVAAALVYLGMGEIPGMTNTWVFLANLPSMALYALAFYRLVTPLRPSELDVAIAAAKGGEAHGGDLPHTLYEDGADPLVDRAVALFKPSSQWCDASQWGPLTLRAPPGFAELEATRKPIVVTYGTNDAASPAGAAGDAKPLLANDRHSGRAPPPPPAAVNDDSDDQDVDAPARDGNNNDAVPPSSCVDKTLGCLMPGAPVWAVKFTHSVVFWNCLNLFSVYVFEYAIQFLAPYSFPDPKKHPGVKYGPCADEPSKTCGHGGFEYDWATKHAFVLSQFCYQVGVLMSRSSLKVVRIRRVWVLSVVQGVNFVLWLIQAKTMLLSSDTSRSAQAAWTVVLLAWMVVVGLMGGASYVNVFYNILNDDDPTYTTNDTEEEEGAPAPPKNEGFNFKELAMNIGALYATAGITVGCLLDVVLSNTLL